MHNYIRYIPSNKRDELYGSDERPKRPFCKYNYDKIQFKYDQYNLHPITQQPIFKDPDNSWGFDCYNRDKDRKYIANRNMSYINTDYQKVWDPITNRFFYGTLQHQL